jgi:hypothetical protein
MSLTTQPTNLNFLSPLGFKLTLARAPTTVFFLQNISIPGISMSETYQPTPFVKIPRPGDHIDYAELSVTFKVDEDLKNWLEVYNWMLSLGFPDNFDQYKRLGKAAKGSEETVSSDINVTILNSAMNPNVEFQFKDAFPTTISQLDLGSTSTDVDYVSATATFRYRVYEIIKL